MVELEVVADYTTEEENVLERVIFPIVTEETLEDFKGKELCSLSVLVHTDIELKEAPYYVELDVDEDTTPNEIDTMLSEIVNNITENNELEFLAVLEACSYNSYTIKMWHDTAVINYDYSFYKDLDEFDNDWCDLNGVTDFVEPYIDWDKVHDDMSDNIYETCYGYVWLYD